VHHTDATVIIRYRILFLPDNAGDEVHFTKYFIHQQTQVMNLVVVYADEDDAVLPQQIPR
jgi:hypothetical protein